MLSHARRFDGPLLRFLLVGLLIFALDRVTQPDPRSSVVVTEAQVARLAALWERQWRRPPTAAELERLVDDHVREELFFREALRLGLDREDPIVRRRLAQKFAFLAEDRAIPEAPAEATLRELFEADPGRYSTPARLTLRQIPFTATRPEEDARALAEAALEQLRSDEAPMLAALGDPSLLPRAVRGWTRAEVAREFGDDFAAAIDALPTERWTGPVPSAFGIHLVRLETREPSRTPTFAAVRDEVERDWRESRRAAADERVYAELLERYDVRIDVDGVALRGPAT